MIEDLGAWLTEVGATLSTGAFWLGIGSGAVLGVAVLVAVVAHLPEPGPSRRQQRQALAQRAYRWWCADHEWCPVHDVADGQ